MGWACVFSHSPLWDAYGVYAAYPSCLAVYHSFTLRYQGGRPGTFRIRNPSHAFPYNRCIDAVFDQKLCTV